MTKTFSLASADFIKALLMAIIVPVVGFIATALQSGSLAIDWHQVLVLAISGGVGYLVKQFSTSTTVTTVPPETAPQATVTEKVMGITLPKA